MEEQQEKTKHLQNYLDVAISAANLYIRDYRLINDTKKLEVMTYHEKVLQEIQSRLDDVKRCDKTHLNPVKFNFSSNQ